MYNAASDGYSFDYHAEPTLARFHCSDAFIRGVRGPYGSGKSVAVGVSEILMRANAQEPDRYGRRKTRWGAVRNTYGELKMTTIKTWQEWVPQEICPLKWDEPITGRMVRKLPDGTTLDLEIIFIAVDRPAHIKKLKSFELTGLWLNEASEMAKEILDAGSARVGRYPAKKDGAPYTWCGVIMDTNSMDDDHWWHDLDVGPTDEDRRIEIEQLMEGLHTALKELGHDRPLIEFFDQPPALIEAQGSYVPNPDAENIKNQPLGAAYWLQLIAGKEKEWVDIYVMNQYGRVIDGKPVYPEYNPEIHGKAISLRPIAGRVITIGMDYGLSPAAIFMQQTAKGQLLVLGECVAKERSMGFENFATMALRPYMAERFGESDSNGMPWEFEFTGDPTGSRRAESDEGSVITIGADLGINIMGAKTNAFPARREALAFFMNRLVEGKSALLIDESCRMFKKGLKGGYHYRRVQIIGEARYQDQPYKNKYSHPVEAGQYGAMKYVAIDSPASSDKMVPEWQRKANARLGLTGRPWKKRGFHASRRTGLYS